jgi:hypothetical protein
MRGPTHSNSTSTTSSQIHLVRRHHGDRYLELVASVRALVTIPLAVKIGPFFLGGQHGGSPGRSRRDGSCCSTVSCSRTRPDPRSFPSDARSPDEIDARMDRDPAGAAAPARRVGWHPHVGGGAKVLLAGADVAMMTSALLGRARASVAGRDDLPLDAGRSYESVSQLRGSMASVPTRRSSARELHEDADLSPAKSDGGYGGPPADARGHRSHQRQSRATASCTPRRAEVACRPCACGTISHRTHRNSSAVRSRSRWGTLTSW